MESVWYYARGGAQTGPVSFDDLKAAVAAGKLGAEDLVWKEGTADWIPARAVAGLFPMPAPPPTPAAIAPAPPRAPAPSRFPSRGPAEALPLADEATPAPPPVSAPAAQSSEIIEMAKLFVRRAVASNPAAIVPIIQEDRLLTQAGFEAATRRLMVWRRAMLWVAVVPLGFAALFQLISLLDMETNDKAMLSPLGTVLLFLETFSLCALPFVAAFGAILFDRPAKSARIVLIGTLVTVVIPLLVAFIPTNWYIAGPGAGGDSSEVRLMKFGYARQMGYQLGILVLPLVLSVLPAVTRSCVKVKGFLPESLVPGWVLAASVPLLIFFTFAALIAVYHIASNILLLLGLLILIGSPLLYFTRFKLLTRPVTSSQDLAALAKAQMHVLAAVGVGILILFIYLFGVKMGEDKLVGFDKENSIMRPWSLRIHRFWLEYLGRSLFLTVFFADLLVRMAVMTWREERAFAGSGSAANFDQTMSAMGEAFETKLVPPVA
jgi:hypothetical protein